MADVLDYVAGAKFVFRVRSSLTSNRRVRWHNSYEARATEDGGNDLLLALASTIVGWQYQLLYTYVTIDQITIATWEPDSHPYNPLGFTTVVYNQVGSQSMLGELAVSLRQTLFLKRMATTGLTGKLFLRGALVQSELAYADGEWGLADTAAKQTLVDSVTTSTGLADHLNGLGSNNFALALLGNDSETRFQTAWSVGGTTDVKLNHKYFDRAPTP